MAYTKNTTWVDNVSPLSATRLNKLEDQYAQVKAELAEAGTSDIRVHAKNIDNGGDGSGLSAELYGGLRWVKPGDTVLLEALDEVSNDTNVPAIRKSFRLIRPGMYRLTGEIKSSNGNLARIALYIDDNDGGYCKRMITNEFSTTSTTYVEFSIDMITPVFIQDIYLGIAIVTTATVFAKNIRIKYENGIPDSGLDAMVL